MAWHQRHRLGLLQARLALADGDRERAVGLATDVVADARERRALRYVVLAEAVVALAGGSDDLDAIGATVEGLGGCAALEAWWLTAELGRHFAVDAWTQLAGQRAAELIRAAGTLQRQPHHADGRRVLSVKTEPRGVRDSTERSRTGGSDPSSAIASSSSAPREAGSSPARNPASWAMPSRQRDHLGRSELGERHRPRLDRDLGQAGGGGRVRGPGRRSPAAARPARGPTGTTRPGSHPSGAATSSTTPLTGWVSSSA